MSERQYIGSMDFVRLRDAGCIVPGSVLEAVLGRGCDHGPSLYVVCPRGKVHEVGDGGVGDCVPDVAALLNTESMPEGWRVVGYVSPEDWLGDDGAFNHRQERSCGGAPLRGMYRISPRCAQNVLRVLEARRGDTVRRE